MKASVQPSVPLNGILILSLGQLTEPNIWSSIHAFTSLSVRYRHTNDYICGNILSWLSDKAVYPIYFVNTLVRYGYDLYIGKQIEKYKVGGLTTDEFIEFLKKQFGKNIKGEELKDAWNKMCVVSDKCKEGFKYLVNYANSAKIALIIVARDNPLQSDYIKKQLIEKLADHDDHQLHKLHNVIFPESFEKKSLSLKKLAETAITGLTETAFQSRNSIGAVSLHKEISSLDNCGLEIHFKQIGFNPSKNTFVDILHNVDQYMLHDAKGWTL